MSPARQPGFTVLGLTVVGLEAGNWKLATGHWQLSHLNQSLNAS
jgi:hypothetical protein